MGLARKQKLHGATTVVDDSVQSVDVRKQQIGPFIGGKPPSESDGQATRIHQVASVFDSGIAFAAAPQLAAEAAADERK